MNWSHVKLILSRELRDQLRDRRTLFTIAVLPLLLYPLLGMVFLQVAQFTRQYPAHIWVIGSGQLPDTPPLMKDGRFVGALFASPNDADLLESTLDNVPSGSPVAAAQQAVQKGRFDAVIYFPPTFGQQLARFRADAPYPRDTSSQEESEVPSPEVFYDAARDESRIAHIRLTGVLAKWREQIVRHNLQERNVPVAAASPFEVVITDVALEERRRAAIWSKVLPFVVLIWALTGAFHPAIDLCAGEKERGTLETLLSSPVGRSEIVWGKLLAVMLFSIATSLLNLFSMGVTTSFIMRQMEQLGTIVPALHMGPPPLSSIAWLVLALIPISALFSALSIAIATQARSAKEGQYYLVPLLLVTMPLMILPTLPSVQLDLGTSLIPITGVMLLLRSLMEAEYALATQYAVPVIGITVLCCLLAIRWAVDQFNNESVLFRQGERMNLGLWIRHLVRDRGDTPTVGEAVLCGLLLLVIRFFTGFQEMPKTWTDLSNLMLISQIAFFATPVLLMTVLLTKSPRRTLLLNMPLLLTIPASILLAMFLHPPATATAHWLARLYPLDDAVGQEFAQLLSQAPSIWSLLLILALTPAICEEIAFRGFILSGLRHMGHRWRAIILSSLLFGIAHGIIQQSIAATLVGIVIGYVAVQTGSLLPCILFHLTHNALLLLTGVVAQSVDRVPFSRWLISSSADGIGYTWPVIACSAVAAVALLWWFSRLPQQLSAEERLQEALDHQTAHTPS